MGTMIIAVTYLKKQISGRLSKLCWVTQLIREEKNLYSNSTPPDPRASAFNH